MGGVLCLALGVAGKTSPFCPFPSRCLCKKLGNWIYKKNFASYESACQEDPELKTFDSKLQLRTSEFITSLAPRAGKNENPSLDSFMQVCGYLKDLGDNVVKFIIGNHEDVWKNEEAKSLVHIYFEGTSKTLNFFSSVENGVKETENRLLKLRVALKKYETESAFGGSMPNKYAETLEKLTEVTNMGDPFGDDFTKQYKSLLTEHDMNLAKICELQEKLEKKHKNVKKLSRLANAVLVTTFLSTIALKVVPWAVGAHVIGGKVLSDSIGPAGIWLNRMMSSDEALEKQIKSLELSGENTKVGMMESMKTIKNLVMMLQLQIKSISQTVEDAVQSREEENAMELVMQQIIKKVNEFAKKIDFVSEEVASYTKCVIEGKDCVMKHITRSIF